MYFKMPHTNRLAWGNPKANQLPEAVQRLKVATHPASRAVGIFFLTMAALSLLIFLASIWADALVVPVGILIAVLAALTISGGIRNYLDRGKKKAEQTIGEAHDRSQVILVDSDGYRLLNDALFRRFRLVLGTLLNSPQYHQVMLSYMRDIEERVASLSLANGRQAERAAHKQLVDIAEATAVAIAQIYAAENAIEV